MRSAEGWLELGNEVEANAELGQITPEFRAHPAVLLKRCEIYLVTKKWDMVLAVAETLVRNKLKLPEGWIHRSYALHEMKRTQEAYDLLLPAVEKFPKLCLVHYNLACYACQLGNLEEAKKRLERAIDLAGTHRDIRAQALDDPDLEPLWEEIGSLGG